MARAWCAPAFLLRLDASVQPCLRFLGLQKNEPEQELPSLLTMLSADPWRPPRCCFIPQNLELEDACLVLPVSLPSIPAGAARLNTFYFFVTF